MDTGKFCAQKFDWKSHRRRSIVRRLWESYAVDLITILRWANEGKVDQNEAQIAMQELIPAMKELRDKGEVEKTLTKADLIILES